MHADCRHVAGTCEVSNSGSQVDIGASGTIPGGGSHDDRHSDAPRPPADPTPPPAEDCPLDRCDLPYDVVGPPDVTLADLASFRPAAPTLAGEPAGFGVVGMPTNVMATASEQRIAGTLLGWDVTVRFVPAGFVFDYGDGSTARSTSGGASWQRLGQAQFTPTATSHVYRERGTFPVSVDRAVRGIRRFRLGSLATGRRLRHRDHRRVRRPRRRGAHRTRRPDLPREPARTRLLRPPDTPDTTAARRYPPSSRTA